jgi:hypothetical protein
MDYKKYMKYKYKLKKKYQYAGNCTSEPERCGLLYSGRCGITNKADIEDNLEEDICMCNNVSGVCVKKDGLRGITQQLENLKDEKQLYLDNINLFKDQQLELDTLNNYKKNISKLITDKIDETSKKKQKIEKKLDEKYNDIVVEPTQLTTDYDSESSVKSTITNNTQTENSSYSDYDSTSNADDEDEDDDEYENEDEDDDEDENEDDDDDENEYGNEYGNEYEHENEYGKKHSWDSDSSIDIHTSPISTPNIKGLTPTPNIYDKYELDSIFGPSSDSN